MVSALGRDGELEQSVQGRVHFRTHYPAPRSATPRHETYEYLSAWTRPVVVRYAVVMWPGMLCDDPAFLIPNFDGHDNKVEDARWLDQIAPIAWDRTLWFPGDINSIGPLHNGASLVGEHHYAIP